VFPRAGEGGQHGDGARGCAAVVAALHAVVEADDGGRGGGVFAGEALDVGDGDAGPVRGDALGRIFGDALAQLIEAAGPAGDIVLVEEPVAHDDVHHAQGESGVGAGVDGDVPVRGAAVRVA
jgi:hypothetical protein